MGLFDNIKINFGSNKKKNIEPVKLKSVTEDKVDLLSSITTDYKDLSMPEVDDFYRGRNFIFFGSDNLYPDILNQLYTTSTMHSACVDFKTWSIIGENYEWLGYDKLTSDKKIDIKHFEYNNKFKNVTEELTRDYIKHGRAIVLLTYDQKSNKYKKMTRLDPSEIRNNVATPFQDPTQYFYSNDWGKRMSLKKFSPYCRGCKSKYQILELKNVVGKTRTYGLPDWISSSNWMKVGADLGLLHKSAIENGIQPGVLYKYPYHMTPDEHDSWLANTRTNSKGATNYNKAQLIMARNKEQMPEIEVMETSQNHKLFEQTSKEQKEEIAISHNINPTLMGVRVAGSLGQTEEMEISARQFEKIWLNKNRDIMNDFFNEIINVFDLNVKLNINKVSII